MNEVDSPTRGYRTSINGGWWNKKPMQFCCGEEHKTLEAAFECGMNQGWDPDNMRLTAIDWAFGLRAKAPTFGDEWVRENKIRAAYRASKSTVE